MSNDPNMRGTPQYAGINIAVMIFYGFAAAVCLPMRCRAGREFTDSAGIGALISIFLFALLVHDLDVCYVYLVFVPALVCHRLQQLRSWLNRVPEHTFYSGEPWLARRLFGFRDETRAKLIGEPLIAAAVGLALTPVSKALGTFYLCGSAAVFTAVAMFLIETRRQIDRAMNARIEAENTAEQLRRFNRP